MAAHVLTTQVRSTIAQLTYLHCQPAGTIEVDAHTAMLTLSVFLFLSFPFGIATASTIRVGNLLGAGEASTAKLSGKVSEIICHHCCLFVITEAD